MNLTTPGEITRPFYALLISLALISAHLANIQYAKGLQGTLMRSVNDFRNISVKTAIPLIMCCTLGIAASSMGSATQDLAGDKVCTSVGNFFSGGDVSKYCQNSWWNSIFACAGHILAGVSLGVTPMTYCDVFDLGKGIFNLNNWKEAPATLYQFAKAHPWFTAIFPLFQLTSQGQTAGYSLTAFIKFQKYFGENGANVAFLVATAARVALVSRSALFAQRRLDSAIHEMNNSYEKQIDDLIKVLVALEEKDFDQDKKNQLRQNLAQKLLLESGDDLLKQLEAKRSDLALEEHIKKQGGIKNILQKVEEKTKISEFSPLEHYQELTEFQYSQILPWIALFANGIANSVTVSDTLPMPRIFGGGNLPGGLRDFSAIVTSLVSTAICSRYLGFKTKEERENMRKYVDGLIGDEQARSNLISKFTVNIIAELEKRKCASEDEMVEVISVQADKITDSIVEESGIKTSESIDAYKRLNSDEQKLIDRYIYGKPSDSRRKSDIQNEVIQKLIDGNQDEISGLKNFLAGKIKEDEANELMNKLGVVQIERQLNNFAEALSQIRESPRATEPSRSPKNNESATPGINPGVLSLHE